MRSGNPARQAVLDARRPVRGGSRAGRRSVKPPRTPGSHRWGWTPWIAVSALAAVPGSLALGWQQPETVTFSTYLISMLVQLAIAYVVVLGSARALLAGETFRQSVRWALRDRSLTRLASTALVGTGFLVLVQLSGFATADRVTWYAYALLVTVIGLARGLSYLYRAQYAEFIDPSIDDRDGRDRSFKGRMKRTLSRKPHLLIAPYVQAILVVLVPTWLVTTLLSGIMGLDYGVATTIGSALIPAFGAAWAQWHVWGGIGRITRITAGRPMRPVRGS